MVDCTTPLAEVYSAFVDARGWAHGASTRCLRRKVRRWERHRDRLDQPTLARLKAVRYELAARS